MNKLTPIILLLSILIFSCAEKPKEVPPIEYEIQKISDPNGVSELALLMRAMFDEAQQIKEQIAKDTALTFTLDHEKIKTADATEPEKIASPTYQAYATAYLEIIENLKKASPHQRIDLYDSMVGNCMSCHQALCPGPMVRIKHLQ